MSAQPKLTFGTPEENLRTAAEFAAANLLLVQDAIAKKLQDPTLTGRQLVDFGEHVYKVSGMQKKQEVKDESGKFILNIIMGDGQSVTIEKTIDGDVVEDSPEALSNDAKTLNLSLPFPECPEFTAAMAVEA